MSGWPRGPALVRCGIVLSFRHLPFAAAAAVLVSLAAAPSAGAQITPVSPADGETLNMTASSSNEPRRATAQMRVTWPSGTSTLGPSLAISRTQGLNADGTLRNDGSIYSGLWMTSYGNEPGTWTANVTLSATGAYYWQATARVCDYNPSTFTSDCRTIATPIRTVSVQDPPKVAAAPRPAGPRDGAAVDVDEPFEFEVSDPTASKLTIDVRDAAGSVVAQVAADRDGTTFAGIWTPRKTGRFSWQARRGGCRPGSGLYPQPIDCTTQALSPARVVNVRMPARSLSVDGDRHTWRGGRIPVEVDCRPAPCKLTMTASAQGRRLVRVTRRVSDTAVRLAPSRSARGWLGARLARGSGGRVRARVTVRGRDRYGRALPRRQGTVTLVARKAPPPPPTPQQRAAARATRTAEREVRYRVASRYEIGLDRAYADCERRGSGRYRCTWSTDSLHEPWGETCLYSGEADARRIGSYWDVRLYDISNTCY